MPTEVRVLADAGYKLEATKRYEMSAGLEFMDAKKAVDAYVVSRDQDAGSLTAK